MNKLLHTTGILLTLCLVLFTSVKAQQKQGYVDSDYLVSQIPEYQSVQQQLSLLSQEWKKRLEEMQREINQMREDFAAKEILYTDDMREGKKREIQLKVEERQRYLQQKFGADGEYFQKQKELLEPLQRRVYEAISAVAQREGFDFVFDRSRNTEILYAREEWNLNDKVLLEMGITPEETSN